MIELKSILAEKKRREKSDPDLLYIDFLLGFLSNAENYTIKESMINKAITDRGYGRNLIEVMKRISMVERSLKTFEHMIYFASLTHQYSSSDGNFQEKIKRLFNVFNDDLNQIIETDKTRLNMLRKFQSSKYPTLVPVIKSRKPGFLCFRRSWLLVLMYVNGLREWIVNDDRKVFDEIRDAIFGINKHGDEAIFEGLHPGLTEGLKKKSVFHANTSPFEILRELGLFGQMIGGIDREIDLLRGIPNNELFPLCVDPSKTN